MCIEVTNRQGKDAKGILERSGIYIVGDKARLVRRRRPSFPASIFTPDTGVSTRLNGRRAVPLSHGDEIHYGNAVFCVQERAPTEVTT